jgi:hypothetical protein
VTGAEEWKGQEDQARKRVVGRQAKALAFYREVLGFVRKIDIPVGELRFLTMASPEASTRRLGMVFQTPPDPAGPVTFAVFDDSGPNLIRIDQG